MKYNTSTIFVWCVWIVVGYFLFKENALNVLLMVIGIQKSIYQLYIFCLMHYTGVV